MHRYVRYAQSVAILWTIFVAWAGSSFANGGPAVPFYKEVAATGDYFVWGYGFFAKIFFTTVAIEYLVVYLLLGRPTKARIQLLFYIILVNVITNPAAQFAILFLADPVLLGSETLANLVLLSIELWVVMVEFGLLRWIFGRMYRRGVLDTAIPARRTFVIAFLSNLASFVGTLGLILLFAVITT